MIDWQGFWTAAIGGMFGGGTFVVMFSAYVVVEVMIEKKRRGL